MQAYDIYDITASLSFRHSDKHILCTSRLSQLSSTSCSVVTSIYVSPEDERPQLTLVQNNLKVIRSHYMLRVKHVLSWQSFVYSRHSLVSWIMDVYYSLRKTLIQNQFNQRYVFTSIFLRSIGIEAGPPDNKQLCSHWTATFNIRPTVCSLVTRGKNENNTMNSSASHYIRLSLRIRHVRYATVNCPLVGQTNKSERQKTLNS